MSRWQAGVFGQAPQPADNLFQLTARAKGRLSTPEEFGGIILKTDTGGQITRLRDVARIELGAADYSIDSRLDGQPTAMIAVFQQPGRQRHPAPPTTSIMRWRS